MKTKGLKTRSKDLGATENDEELFSFEQFLCAIFNVCRQRGSLAACPHPEIGDKGEKHIANGCRRAESNPCDKRKISRNSTI